MLQQRPQTAIPFPTLSRHQQSQVVAVTQPSHIANTVKPVLNPPPPYPNEDNIAMRPPAAPQQINSAPQVNGASFSLSQTTTTTTTSNLTSPANVPQSQLTSVTVAQSVPGNYRVGVAASNTSLISHPGRAVVRAPANVVKNSPLLVGLLQQPDQPSSGAVKSGKNTPTGTPPPTNSLTVTGGNVTPTPAVDPSIPISNNSLPGTSVATPSPPPGNVYSGNNYLGRSRDGHTTMQQVYSGGSVITSSVTPTRVPVTGALQHHPQATGQPPPLNTASRVNYPVEQRRISVTANPQTKTANNLTSVTSALTTPSIPITSGTQASLQGSNTGVRQSIPNEARNSAQSGGVISKESQYLINPNTGLLEPRPNTDSSDSEPEARPLTPGLAEEPPVNSVVSDEESNLSNASKKETDQSDSDASRVSVEARIVVQERVKSRDSSPGSSKEGSFVSAPNSYEKIKLRLKLPKEPSVSTSEPRVPKFYIKLDSNSNQPVIVNPIDEGGTGRKNADKETIREDKNKRKSNRNKTRNSDSDNDNKLKGVKVKSNKDRLGGEDVVNPVIKIIDSKKCKSENDEESSVCMKIKDNTSEGRLKTSRTEGRVSKSDSSKLTSKLENKLRTRLKTKSPIRKVGDLNSVGGIASHKILETLPPSITKVAALTTQHPHRNPSFSCMPSVCSSSTSSCPVTLSSSNACAQSSGELLKAQLEKRGSELLGKSERRTDFDKSAGDSSVNKVRISNSSMSSLMNGDVPINEKCISNRVRLKKSAHSLASCSAEVSGGSKLTIKRKGSEETHTLESLKKDFPEGMLVFFDF